MKRKIIKILSGLIIFGLVFVIPACTFPALSVVPDYNATFTQVSIQFTQTFVASTPTFTPPITSSPTPSPTLDPFFLTLTPQIVSTYLSPTTGPRPAYYVLQSGEFPYCIARRFNIDPKELLAINNLSSGLIYAPGLVLSIPQSGRPFPSLRALHPHPATYTVTESQMSVYKIACYFGDVDPVAIMQRNGLTSPIVSLGMTLQIP